MGFGAYLTIQAAMGNAALAALTDGAGPVRP